MVKVLYPGSFDSITKGHMNIIEQASNLCDEVVVAVLFNPNKKNVFFEPEKRMALIKKIYENDKKVSVVLDNGAAVDVALANDCRAIVRGLRGITDFDYEISMQQVNKEISNNDVNTICFFADSTYQFLSSSIVKELFSLGKDITKYVDDMVREEMEVKTYGSKNVR